MPNKINGMKIIVTIVERRQGKIMAKLYTDNNVIWHYYSVGEGTATSELLGALGFGTSEREILFSLAPTDVANELMYNLNNDFRGNVETKGIIFDIPLTGISNIAASFFVNRPSTEVEEKVMIEQGENYYSLVIVSVNAGNTDAVMETAKKAGARGGTVIRSRFVPNEEIESFYGITLQEEKELIAIVAPKQTRNIIMESINAEHGLNSDAGAVVCSVGIDHIVRLS